ncbi:MAG: DUF983 domain-containing protein [Actinomycetota bacterium]
MGTGNGSGTNGGTRHEPPSLGEVLGTPEVEQLRRERGPAPSEPRPGTTAVLVRALRVRCPRCASPGLFASVFSIKRVCPTCELPLEREEGGFLGAMTVNYLVTAVAFVAVLVAWLIADLPDVSTAGLIVTSAIVVVAVPLLFFRRAKVIWAGIDYLVWRTQPGYVPRAR